MIAKNRLVAFSAACALGLGLALPGVAAAQENNSGVSAEGSKALNEFGACVAQSEEADVLVVLDESGSLKGEGAEATDPDNVRVDSAKDLVGQLGLMAQDTGATVNVKLAGFGEGYRSDPEVYGDWVNVGDDAGALDEAIDGARDRNNDGYTIYGDAFQGMLSEFGAHSSSDACQVVLFFTDGLLTVPGEASADETARREICEPGSPVGALRQAGIQLFTVGLIPREGDSPEQLLRLISEGPDCTNAAPNGAYFNAGDDAARLYTAFRSLIPAPGSTEARKNTHEPFEFYLDNSIEKIRVAAQPQEKLDEGALIPVLRAPNGETIDLTSGSHDFAGNTLEVETNENLPGMFDAEMTAENTDQWAGKWELSYRLEGDADTEYYAQTRLSPGIHLDAAQLSEGTSALRSDEALEVSLLKSNGDVVNLEGEADLTASLTTDSGEEIDLGQTSIKEGTASVPLESINEPLAGVLNLEAVITTRGDGNAPGTTLSPVALQERVSIVPVNMPRVAPGVETVIEEQSTTLSVPVEGPGSVWLPGGDYAADGEGVVLPEGAEGVSVSSSHDSAENALTLGEGESGEITLTIDTETLADGPIALPTVATIESAEGNATADVSTEISGSMRAPVSGTAFSLVLVIVALLSLLIPLGVMYLMKMVTGRIPTHVRLHSYAYPVVTKNSQLYHAGNETPFSASYEDVVNKTKATAPSASSASLAGHQVNVVRGWNPFTPANVVADAPFSIADDGAQQGNSAKLPLALNNHWFVVADPNNKNAGTVVVVVDERADRQRVDNISREISTRGAERLERVSEQAQQAASGQAHDSGKPNQRGPQGGAGQQGPGGPVAPDQRGPQGPQWQQGGPAQSNDELADQWKAPDSFGGGSSGGQQGPGFRPPGNGNGGGSNGNNPFGRP